MKSSCHLNLMLAVVAVLVLASDATAAAPPAHKQHYYQYNGVEFSRVALPKLDNMKDDYEYLRHHSNYTGQSLQGNDVFCLCRSSPAALITNDYHPSFF